jgi:predicted metal-binding protein
MKRQSKSGSTRRTSRVSGGGALERFLEHALGRGVDEARVIRASTVRCAPWVRLKCQFGCGGYNKRLTCPPFTPKPEETAAVVACYKRAILLHGRDTESINRIIPGLEREVFLAGYYKALGLGSGPCHRCTRCDTKGRCVHPYAARPSMEACGIDVYATARANGLEINVVRRHDQRGDYYGLVLVD